MDTGIIIFWMIHKNKIPRFYPMNLVDTGCRSRCIAYKVCPNERSDPGEWYRLIKTHGEIICVKVTGNTAPIRLQPAFFAIKHIFQSTSLKKNQEAFQVVIIEWLRLILKPSAGFTLTCKKITTHLLLPKALLY